MCVRVLSIGLFPLFEGGFCKYRTTVLVKFVSRVSFVRVGGFVCVWEGRRGGLGG